MLFKMAAFNEKENQVVFDKESKVIHHKRYKYHKKWQGKTMSTYWCAFCKSSKSKCSSKIKVDFFGKVIKKVGSHDVECSLKNKNSRQALQQLQVSKKEDANLDGIDFSSFMKKRADELAIENLHLKPMQIWSKVVEELNDLQPTWRGLTQYQVITRIRNIRTKLQGPDLVRNIEDAPLAKMKDSNKFFFQFNCTIIDDTKEQSTAERIMGFGNPYLFYYKSNSESLFIDATFAVAPKPFYQCLVVMIFDKSLQIYIPILYILMTNKSQKMYRNALEWIFKLSGRRICPKTVSCDFELALINAVQSIFPFAKITGCLFHWKQAIFRKLSSLKFHNEKEIISYAMHKFSMDILTVIPKNEIITKGIPFVKDNLKDAILEADDRLKMDKFWIYFKRFWMSSDKMIDSWNISNYNGNKNTLKRTNNGLECYNKRMKSLFNAGTPSFADFVNTMREESEFQQKKVDGYMNKTIVNRNTVDENDGNFIYNPPPCYANWTPSSFEN